MHGPSSHAGGLGLWEKLFEISICSAMICLHNNKLLTTMYPRLPSHGKEELTRGWFEERKIALSSIVSFPFYKWFENYGGGGKGKWYIIPLPILTLECIRGNDVLDCPSFLYSASCIKCGNAECWMLSCHKIVSIAKAESFGFVCHLFGQSKFSHCIQSQQ